VTRSRPRLGRSLAKYGLAAATTAVATAFSLAVRPLVHSTPSPPFIVSVLVTAWVGGIGPALFATFLAAVSLDLVGGSTFEALAPSEEAITRVVVFVIVAVGVGALAAARRRAEEERVMLLDKAQRARAEAEAANRNKAEFVTMLAHELRTPLTVTLGAASALAGGRLDATATARSIAAIERNVQLQARLISDLVDLARLGHGKVSLEKRAVNLKEIVDAAAENIAAAARARNLKIAVDADRGCPIVTGDPIRLEQVVSNLLSNAVRHSDEGGTVSVKLQIIDRWARIDVDDGGMGIPPELLTQIFEPYRQRTPGFGLGLGLAIVRELVELHGGHVEAHSDGVGCGARFTVLLPREHGCGDRGPAFELSVSP